MKIKFSATINEVLLVEQFAISINLVSVFRLRYMVFLPSKAVNNAGMHAKTHAMP
jgi:hypothetical protein